MNSNLSKVQKKKKAKKLAPFMIFAFELKNKLKRDGIHVDFGTQLQEMAGKKWNELSNEEKEKYKEKSQKSEAVLTPYRSIFNSLGQNLEEVEAKKRQEEKLNKEKLENIKTLIQEAREVGELDDLVFFLVTSTKFFESSDDIFPAEIALAKFSLKRGIIDEVQIRVNPGELPMGSTYAATEHSKKVHKYPLPPKCEGEKDYLTVFEKIIRFLHPLENLPIFFTEGNSQDNPEPLRTTQKIMQKIFYEAQEDDMFDKVKIYPVEELFFALQRMSVTIINQLNQTKLASIPSPVFAADLLFNQNNFEYSTVGCDFHEKEHVSINCCLSRVRRYCYAIFEMCCNKTKYALIEGAHFPKSYEAK